jgi:hypothetical protein
MKAVVWRAILIQISHTPPMMDLGMLALFLLASVLLKDTQNVMIIPS